MAMASHILSWNESFPTLLIAALITTVQPVGSVLGVSADLGFLLRASPIVCAADALGLIIRFFTYCFLLPTVPEKAICIIGIDRFGKSEPDFSSWKTRAPIVRLAALLLCTWPLFLVDGAWGEMRWTVAWSGMFVFSYIVLEVALQLARTKLGQPQYTSANLADFELGEAPEVAMGHESEINAENENSERESTESLLRQWGKAGQSTKGDNTPPRDPEAGSCGLRICTDSIASPRFPDLQKKLLLVDKLLLAISCLVHLVFLNWAYLDLLRPFTNKHVLLSSGWNTPLRCLTAVFMFVLDILATGSSFLCGLVVIGMFLYWASFMGGKFPTSIRQKCHIAVYIIFGFIGVLGGSALWLYIWTWSAATIHSDDLYTLHRLIAVDLVTLLMFLSGSFSFYLFLKSALKAKAATDWPEKQEALFLTCYLANFAVLFLWYRSRYASSADWTTLWAEALVLKSTVNN